MVRTYVINVPMDTSCEKDCVKVSTESFINFVVSASSLWCWDFLASIACCRISWTYNWNLNTAKETVQFQIFVVFSPRFRTVKFSFFFFLLSQRTLVGTVFMSPPIFRFVFIEFHCHNRTATFPIFYLNRHDERTAWKLRNIHPISHLSGIVHCHLRYTAEFNVGRVSCWPSRCSVYIGVGILASYESVANIEQQQWATTAWRFVQGLSFRSEHAIESLLSTQRNRVSKLWFCAVFFSSLI